MKGHLLHDPGLPAVVIWQSQFARMPRIDAVNFGAWIYQLRPGGRRVLKGQEHDSMHISQSLCFPKKERKRISPVG
jgi:hypothetical protein